LQRAIARHRAAGGMVVLSTHGGLDVPDAAFLDLSARARAAA
jgi:ABC-type transport system involved in cytochrome c biogenesis ATPase subunit